MAVLSKIRERSMFLIIIIGLALFAFVLDPSTLGDFFNSNKINEVGQINGESITRQEFIQELESYKQQVGNSVPEMQAVNTVWENILRKKIYQNQLNEAGITIGESDVWNELIAIPFVQNNPEYQNEAGLFDEQKFKQFLADTKENNKELWAQWSSYMGQIRDNLSTTTYNNLITAGLGASLKEGESEYLYENTKLNAEFVYLPYTSISDSLVKIKKSEVESYIKKHEDDYKVDASRDINYVTFEILPTVEDENVLKAEVFSLIEDFKLATNDNLFLSENESDSNLDASFLYKNQVSQEVADSIFLGSKGKVVGPYTENEFLKVSKITEISRIPDSVKASHILIPFIGAQRVAPEVTRTEESAKKLADSILQVVKGKSDKFAILAKEFSSDKSNSDKGGDLDWFTYTRMTTEFRDYTFTGKKGDLGVVKTAFGFHVIKIDDQKNIQNVVKLATFSRKIIPSEATENSIFRNAEEFSLAVSKDNKFMDVANKKKFTVKPAIGIKALDENVPGLGNQRQIVTWAFNKYTKVGDFKRFDLEGLHVVVYLTASQEKGLMSADKAINSVRPILVNEKKAEILAKKLQGSNLQSIAKSNNTNVKAAEGVTLKSPTLSGVGVEPKIVGAMYNAQQNKIYNSIVGDRGVYAFKMTKKEIPVALPNYEINRKRISDIRKNSTYKMYEAIKKALDIEDNRANVYSVN
ncbi:MAG: peptidylprolyl isomerase [Cryomorphaceae bacterium BACL22 MAG-120619-bin32]|nr:MAG: peptidylprolyl isomerase [Cryomorphaceae bacterium BACL22 MAG-120619-bin32]